MKYIIIAFILSLFFVTKNNTETETITNIEYVKYIRKDSVHVFWKGSYNLLRTNTTSKFFKKTTLVNNTEVSGGLEFNPTDAKDVLFKNYVTNKMYSEDLIGFKFFYIKDTINTIKWAVKNEQKEILGYTCTLAEATFRGRIYEAWFTSELISGGPWKLDGLPGMILKADTKDGYLSFEASKIVIQTKEKTAIDNSNPFALKKKFLSWEEFKKLYKKKAIEVSKYSPEDNTRVISPKIRTERYIEENDPDYLKNNTLEGSKN